jgi:uncharacterized membrane-anchored protein
VEDYEFQYYIDSVNNSFHYQYGKISIEDGKAWVKVPEGFKFLDAEQAATVLFDLWGNQPCAISGLLLKENEDPLSMDFTYAIEINYSHSGYISDDDAQDIDYDELLEDMQTDIEDNNEKLIDAGYAPQHLVGWASKPYYDENRKILFWAKEFKFGGEEENTLNYNYIFLGRDGYFTYNVIGTMDVLDEVRNEQNNFLSSLTYTPGNTYNDFDPDYDKIAAIGIGGLVAGKVIAKSGILVLLAKFWKLIAIGVVGIGGFISRVFFRGDK